MDAAPEGPAFRTLSDAVLAVASERAVEPVLQQLVDAARELAGARYAALGVPDGDGRVRALHHRGMSDELIAAIGPLPRTHGLLGAMLEADRAVPHRATSARDPRFRGWWPDGPPRDALVPRRADRRARRA